VDPLAERHPEISSFVYCNNIPTYFVDPDGRDWRINYTDNDGKAQTFIYNGGATAIPNNQFVKNFVAAYRHNVENGGGDSMKAIAENSSIIVDVQQTNGRSVNDSQSGPNGYNVLNWNPAMGIETTNGSVLSPATVLEHEAAHALGFALNPELNKKLESTTDKKYDTKEEKRVVEGPEQKTARANGDVKSFGPKVTRDNHNGLPVITTSSTSNKVNNSKTYKFLLSLLKTTDGSTNYFPGFSRSDIEKYNTSK
jgi:hypothetical protein